MVGDSQLGKGGGKRGGKKGGGVSLGAFSTITFFSQSGVLKFVFFFLFCVIIFWQVLFSLYVDDIALQNFNAL